MDPSARRAEFRRLHQSGCFVIPNPWDRGSARALALSGFQALATTSAGYAFSAGLPDEVDSVPVDDMLRHVADIVAATELPVNADFQAGYAADPEGVAENVRRCVATGVAGLSIEDNSGDPAHPLYELEVAVERVRAARAAIPPDVVFTARAECFLVGHPDPMRESLRRLLAYADAGADVLFAPGLRTREQIAEVVRAVAPRPLNVLMSAPLFTVAELADMGVRRISVGSALARTAWGAFLRAARGIAENGTFVGFAGAATFAELNGMFRADRGK